MALARIQRRSRLLSQLIGASFLLWLLFVSACALEAVSGGGTPEGEKAFGVADARWPHNDIHVCFVDPRYEAWIAQDKDSYLSLLGFDETRKRSIRESIEAEYTAKRTGIYFYGWKNCHELAPSDPTVDVYIFRSRLTVDPQSGLVSATNKAASIGLSAEQKMCLKFDAADQSYVLDPGACVQLAEGLTVDYHAPLGQKRSLYVAMNGDGRCSRSQRPVDCRKANYVHEFGHMAGLLHTHGRREAMEDPFCVQYENQRNLWSSGYGKITANATTQGLPYDPESIMSYCYLWDLDRDDLPESRRRKPWGLSKLDAKWLKRTYGSQ